MHDKRILDYGCGTGHGTALLASECTQGIGIDVSSEAIAYETAHYAQPGLSFLPVDKAEKSPLPFTSGAFNVVLSFQVIEHIHRLDLYLTEIKRVVAPGGLVLLATPDRSSRLFPFQKPWNRWHVREFSDVQLARLLGLYFEDIQILKMGGKQELISLETRRARRARWLTLPFTLPFVPSKVRFWGLSQLRKLQKRSTHNQEWDPAASNLNEADISISAQEELSINLIAIARKPG